MNTITNQVDAGTEETHRKLALVLGGGGGKGGAHLGVLSMLESLAVPIDMFVGTSIGGVVGVLYAAGYTINEIADTFAATSLWRLMERDPQGLGMLGLKRFRSALEDMLGERTFEDLNIPCAIVAVDLVSGKELVLDSGLLVEALTGAVALPGIFPPLPKDGMIIADAGIINNLPVDVAYQRGADKVIAVDLGFVCDDFQISAAGAGPRSFINLLPNVPLTIANRGLGIMVAQLTRFKLAANPPDLLVCPQVEHIGMLEFVRVAEGQAAGHAAAEALLDQIEEIRDWRVGGEISYLPLRAFALERHAAAEVREAA